MRKLNLVKKWKAGALQFVLFIGVVVFILLMCFVTLNYTHSYFSKRSTSLIKLTKRLDLGLSYAISKKIQLRDTVTMPLNFNENITVKTHRDYWGLFEKYTTVSSFREQRLSKTVLVGSKKQEAPALYLQDLERPLIVVGNTKITGNAFLPKQGIRPGNISGESFYTKQLVYGRIFNSSPEPPNLDRQLMANVEALTSLSFMNSTFELITLKPNTIAQNSFQNNTILITDDRIDLSGITLTGNIIVVATHHINVANSSNLTDIILVAPTISIGDGTTGRFQAFATHQIKIGEGCKMEYPSTIAVSNSNLSTSAIGEKNGSGIVIGSNTSISGLLLYEGKGDGNRFAPQVAIRKGAILNGELYCNQNLELKGTVNGHVSTRSFIALENGSIYQNHLFNGTIDNTTISSNYSGFIFSEDQSKSIVTWLY